MTVVEIGAGLRLHRLPAGTGDAEPTRVVEEWIGMLARGAQRPGATPVCPVDAAGSLRFAPPDTELDDWVLEQDGRVVGSLRLALVAGSDTARVDELFVDVDRRRQGLGRVLHRHALELAARHGRSVLTGTVAEPLAEPPSEHGGPPPGEHGGPPPSKDGGPPPSEHGGPPPSEHGDGELPMPGPGAAPRRFAEAVAAEPAKQPAGLRQLLLLDPAEPVGPPVRPPAGYRLVTWGSVTPDEWAVGSSVLERSLGEGPLDTGDEPVDGSYARRFERMRLGRGRRAHHTGVVRESDGRLTGYTSISMTATHGWHALQGMTVVHASERGRGLGLLLKRANLHLVRGREPLLREVETTNDEDNAPMVALNRAIGFRPHERRVTWQQQVEDPERQRDRQQDRRR